MYNLLIQGLVAVSKPVVKRVVIGVGSGVVATVVGKKIYDKKKKQYDSDGYDQYGYNKDGYNRSGYDKWGYNKEGFDKDGFKKNGYNHLGFDRDGYNVKGFNKDGYDRSGFDKYGYNKEGFRKDGFNCYGFDKYCKNRIGRYEEDVFNEIRVLDKQISKVWENYKVGEYLYVLTYCRQMTEKMCKNFIEHSCGYDSYRHENLMACLKKIENLNLFSEEMLGKLHNARKICNNVIHDNEKADPNSVYFVIKTTEELLSDYKRETGFIKRENIYKNKGAVLK